MKKYLVLAAALLFSGAALAQSVQQSGSVTPNTVPAWNSNGVIKGGVTAADSPVTNFGVTRNGADGICVNSDRQTAAGRNTLCLQASTTGAAKIVLQNYGTATAQDLQFVINGSVVTIPTGGASFLQLSGAAINGHMPCFSGTTGLVVDCGVGMGNGTQYGVAYYSATDTVTSTGAGSGGQLLLAQSASAPVFASLSGDVQTVSSSGAVTITKVNGIPFASSYTSHGVLIAQGSSQFTAVGTSNVGQCLLSQGSSSDPIWSSCAAGTGSAGGSNTQVQFNNATSLGGSVNLTWVSPALTVGVAGTTTGQVALASSTATGTVTLQAPGVSSAYNFNFPTGAGTTGQAFISGGGGSTPNTFGTLGVFGGGTACSAASGTCLDNITGFSSNGFIQRTGSGTYAFSNVISVSGGGTGLANGTSGGIPAFTGATTMTSSGVLAQYSVVAGGGAGAVPATITKGTAGQLLIEQTGANPAWSTMSGDATISSSGALTIANSAVTVGKMANAAAYTLLGNFTGSSAAPQASTIGSLTQKPSPAAGDYLLVVDNAASGQMKYATVSSVSSAGSVSSIDSQTGSFTCANGITCNASVNTIALTAARRTLPTTQIFTSGSGTYTTPANVLWIRITLIGGGGGGGAGGSGQSSGSNGGNTCWNTTGAACTTPVYQAGGGILGLNGVGSAGGAVSGSGTCNVFSNAGGMGLNEASQSVSGVLIGAGGAGGGSALGTGGTGGFNGGGTNAVVPGSGGGGGSATSAATSNSGGGGGAGGHCVTIVGSPAATYTYAVGAAGSAANSSGSGFNGGNGAAGYIVVEEFYNS